MELCACSCSPNRATIEYRQCTVERNPKGSQQPVSRFRAHGNGIRCATGHSIKSSIHTTTATPTTYIHTCQRKRARYNSFMRYLWEFFTYSMNEQKKKTSRLEIELDTSAGNKEIIQLCRSISSHCSELCVRARSRI